MRLIWCTLISSEEERNKISLSWLLFVFLYVCDRLEKTLSVKKATLLKPESIPDQLGYFPSKSRQIWMDTHGYKFHCHAYTKLNYWTILQANVQTESYVKISTRMDGTMIYQLEFVLYASHRNQLVTLWVMRDILNPKSMAYLHKRKRAWWTKWKSLRVDILCMFGCPSNLLSHELILRWI